MIYKKINHKEKQLGLCSAIAVTAKKEMVQRRGHKLGNEVKLPLVVSNDIESIAKTKDLKNALIRLGLGDDIARASLVRKARSGTPRRRGRPTRSGTSALIIVGNDSKLVTLSQSIPGVDIKHAKDISILDLVPGSKPIRLTIFSQGAIEYMKSLQAPMHRVLEVIGK
jgi:large subunit ribosomal protein L4e